jgi:hypothetical protein
MGIDRRWAPLAAVAGVAVAVAAIVVPLALTRVAGDENDGTGPVPGNPQQPTDSAPAALPADNGAGVPVEGQGTLYRDRTGPIRLCKSVIVTLDMPTSSASCDRVAVPTTGVEDHWLVNTTTHGHAFSAPVRVEGTFHQGTLAVTRVVLAQPDPPPPHPEPPVPCDPPAGGWGMDRGESGPDDWMGLNRLTEHVRAHPERFSDIWEGHPDGPPSGPSGFPSRMVYVVGTTGDVAQAWAELRPMYPGNLCVHQVNRSAADLERIAQRLRDNPATPMSAYPDVIENKVRVGVVALDPATVAVLDAVGRDALILDEPMLQWLD